MSEHASGASSPCQPESPSFSAPLRNSRDCKGYLLSLPSGEAALQHAIKQAKQDVHSKVGATVYKIISKPKHLVQLPMRCNLLQGANAEHVHLCIQTGLRLLTQSGSTSSGTLGAGSWQVLTLSRAFCSHSIPWQLCTHVFSADIRQGGML